nr:hypothetical protein [Candidatus Krumholzibacteria bacterium]
MPKRIALSCSALILLVAILLAGCGQKQDNTPAADTTGPLVAFAPFSGELNIAGGTAHIPVMNAAAEKIMKANPDIRITVAGGGSGLGVQKAG